MSDFGDESYQLKLNGADCFYVENWMGRATPNIKCIVPWKEPDEVPMRIGIAGAHGNEKTKLATRLAKKLDIPLISDVARTAHGTGLRIGKNVDPITQCIIWLGQFYEQLQVAEFVTDLTVIDVLAYTKWLVEHAPCEPGYETLYTSLGNVTQELAHHEYSVIFYVVNSGTPIKDGVRSTDKKFQREVDENVIYFLEAFDMEYVPLSGGINRKLELAYNFLETSGLTADGD